MEYKSSYRSPVGALTLVGDGERLTGLAFHGEAEEGATCDGEDFFAVRETKRWLDLYFTGKEPDFMPPFRFFGTPFCVAVWEILCAIPYGQTVTYGEIAQKIARQRGIPRMSARAVGGAVGRNPIGIIVPCHRVIGTGGKLTGFGGGIATKIELLSLEGIDVSQYSLPDGRRVGEAAE